MSEIFISYRRDDSRWATTLIYEHLATRFTKDQVFIDSDIPVGDDFVKAIIDKSQNCRILIVVIGKEWLTIADDEGNIRIEQDNDFVRLEIAGALAHGALIIPVLIDGAKMPRERD